MYQPFFEFWYKHFCPACHSVNWTYHSHSQRHDPILSPEICECYKCKQRYWLMDEETVEENYPLENFDNDPVKRMDDSGALEDIGRATPNSNNE